MRQYILLAAIAILAVAAIGGGYFYYLNQTKAAFVVMVDVTDDLKSQIDTTEVPQHIAQKSSEWSETGIRFSTLSNFQNNKVTALMIPAEFPLMGNPTKRSKQVQAGYQKMLDTLNQLVQSDTGRPQSVLYAHIARELNILAATQAHIKEAIFYTDCQENTDDFSLYRYADVMQVVSHPDSVKAYFEKQVPLGSLKGITVYFIYNAPTPLAESRFILMANLWGDMFKAKGATVIIGPNLITN